LPVELAEAAAADAVAQWWARAHHVAFRSFDLDDVGAEIREQACTVRAGDGGGEVEDPQAGECLVHFLSLPGDRAQVRACCDSNTV
jgi:hypothetical protein